MKARLQDDYIKLKKELNNTRVLGVGKSSLGKLKTICSNSARVILKAIPAAVIGGITAAAIYNPVGLTAAAIGAVATGGVYGC